MDLFYPLLQDLGNPQTKYLKCHQHLPKWQNPGTQRRQDMDLMIAKSIVRKLRNHFTVRTKPLGSNLKSKVEGTGTLQYLWF